MDRLICVIVILLQAIQANIASDDIQAIQFAPDVCRRHVDAIRPALAQGGRAQELDRETFSDRHLVKHLRKNSSHNRELKRRREKGKRKKLGIFRSQKNTHSSYSSVFITKLSQREKYELMQLNELLKLSQSFVF